MQDLTKIAETLQDAEIAILKAFKRQGYSELESLKGLSQIEFLRASMWLENKGLITSVRKTAKYILLDELGKKYSQTLLPELRLLELLKKQDMTLNNLKKLFSEDELQFALGYLKQKGWIEFSAGFLSATKQGKAAQLSLEGKLLLKLAKAAQLDVSALSPEEQFAYQALKKRKQIIKELDKTRIILSITELGRKVIDLVPKEKRLGGLTSQILKTGEWAKTKFRRYDVAAPVPKIHFGKKQPYFAFLDEVKQKLVEMGFKEMTGPTIETEFWNFDALFQPQNHPARDWTDTYQLKYPKLGDLPDKKLVEAVKSSHEKNWKYKWSEETARKLMPRAHGTALSARQLAKGVEIPGKYFAVARCYRPDVLSAKYLIDFNQLEGFIIDPSLNFRKLLELLRQIAEKFAGTKEIRVIPDYYPFTEPSVEMHAKHPKLGWIELGGAGIFRPELTKPLGIDVPVIAWGLGIDRLAMLKLGIDDIRYLFSNDLNWLREAKVA